jgi:hypothetical protein
MNTIFRFAHLALLLSSLVFHSCTREEAQVLNLRGTVTDGRTTATLGGVETIVSHQVINNGVFNINYEEAARGTTDGNGQFNLEWDRANSNSIRLTAALENYISRNIFINPSAMIAGETYTRNVELFPEAFIQVRLRNTGTGDSGDNIGFRFENANFDCACCDNLIRNYSGAMVDTVIQCKVYGDSWLRYRRVIATSVQDTAITDSAYVPAFNTTLVDIEY